MRSFLERWSLRLVAAAVLIGAWLGASGLRNAPTSTPSLLTYIVGLGSNQQPQAVLAGVDGTSPVTLGGATSALLSPDGSAVAAIDKVKGLSTLTLYSTSGGPQKVLKTSPHFMQLLAGSWSPDSKLLLVLLGAGTSVQLVVFNATTYKYITVVSGVFDGASFQPGGSDQIVYARSANSAVNLFVTSSSGAGPQRQLTHDGHSEYPLWGPKGIAYSRATTRHGSTPASLQLWMIKPDGTTNRRLTTLAPPSGHSGLLIPIAFSDSGEHLLANFVGPNQTEAYVLDLATAATKKGVPAPRDLTGQGNGAIGDAISGKGDLILLTKWTPGGPAPYSIETVGWNGGKPTLLVKNGAYASWNHH